MFLTYYICFKNLYNFLKKFLIKIIERKILKNIIYIYILIIEPVLNFETRI